MGKKLNILTADFETTTVVKRDGETHKEYRERIKDFRAQVYSWAICKRNCLDDYEIKDGISIFSFLEYVSELEDDSMMFFHNGAKFDLHFIAPYLSAMGYKQLVVFNETLETILTTEQMNKLTDSEDVYWGDQVIVEKPRRLKEGEYTMLVDGSFKIMEMKIGLKSTKRTKGIRKNRSLIIRDSNLLFPSSLKGYGETLNHAYKTDRFSKMELEGGYLRTETYNSYEEFVNDGNEQEYLHKDVIVLSEFLHMMNETLPFNKWKITAAGTTYHIWKYDFFGKRLVEKALQREDATITVQEKKDGFKVYWNKITKKRTPYRKVVDYEFNKVLPSKWLNGYWLDGIEKNYTYLHQAYDGGLTMSNPDLAGKLQEDILYIDINSSYPTQMMFGKFPYGVPTVGDSGIDSDLKLYELDVEHAVNKTGLPFIYQMLNETSNKQYMYEIKHHNQLITDVELERFKKYYEGDYSYECIASFNSVDGKDLFGEFIDTFYDMKANAKSPAEKIFAKLMLNSLYGKYGQDIDRSSKMYINGEWINHSQTIDAKYYLPIAVWITAYARMYMVDATGNKFENVVVLDTDSLSIKVPSEIFNGGEKEIKTFLENNYDVEIDGDILGGWDIEYKAKSMIARRAKQYMLTTQEGKKVVKFAGLRLNKEEIDKLNYDEFIYGKKGIKQLRPYRTPTGLVLEDYEKELKAIWEYNLNPSYWFKNEEEFRKDIEKR